VSALFFATCAYAQLNDPDPTLWVMAYIGMGVFPNLILTSCPLREKQLRNLLGAVLTGCAVIMTTVVTFKVVTVMPKLELEASKGLGWHFLEHEEGRDSCGLLLLILHAMYLKVSFLRDARQAMMRRRSSGKLQSSTGSDFISSVMAIGSSHVVQAIFLLGVLAGAVYMWIVHHPYMVAKYKVPHCQGGMFGRDGVAGEL
jgi:hypothetical protein